MRHIEQVSGQNLDPKDRHVQYRAVDGGPVDSMDPDEMMLAMIEVQGDIDPDLGYVGSIEMPPEYISDDDSDDVDSIEAHEERAAPAAEEDVDVSSAVAKFRQQRLSETLAKQSAGQAPTTASVNPQAPAAPIKESAPVSAATTGVDASKKPAPRRAAEAIVPMDLDAQPESDPVFEASVEVFRRQGFPIRKDDETYAVMEFMHLCMRGMESQFKNERRIESDRMLSLMKDYLEAISGATSAHTTLMADQTKSAETLGKRLLHTSRFAAGEFKKAFTKLHDDAKVAMDGQTQAMVSSADDEFDKKLRAMVRDEVRIGLCAGLQIEAGLLNTAINNAAGTLDRASKNAEARSGHGWLANLVTDFESLGLGARLTLGLTGLGVFGLVIYRFI